MMQAQGMEPRGIGETHGLSRRVQSSPSEQPVERAANGLGWFSIGLGLSQLVAPGAVARLIGIDDDERTCTIMRACGAREFASGVAILSNVRPTKSVWGRVFGDLIDVALIGAAFLSPKTDRNRLAIATAAVSAVGVADLLTAVQLSRVQPTSDAGLRKQEIKVSAAVTINRPVQEVSAAWASFRDEPKTHDEPQFTPAPGGRGTEVRVHHLKGDGRRVEAKLRRFKQLVEVGEITQSDASIHVGPHAAQPPKSFDGRKNLGGKDVLR